MLLFACLQDFRSARMIIVGIQVGMIMLVNHFLNLVIGRKFFGGVLVGDWERRRFGVKSSSQGVERRVCHRGGWISFTQGKTI